MANGRGGHKSGISDGSVNILIPYIVNSILKKGFIPYLKKTFILLGERER